MKFRKKPIVIEAYQTEKEKIIHTLEGDMKASVGDYIITGVRGEPYPCKPDIFKQTYELVNGEEGINMTIGEAIEALKRGQRCARKAWNGKNQYIELVKNASYVDNNGRVINAEHETMGNTVIAFVGTSGVQLGWLASQADLLSNDWYTVEKQSV